MSGEKTLLRREKRLHIGKKRALYLPREFLELLGLSEGDPVYVKIEDDRIVITRAPDPFLLAVKREKWAHTSVDEFEEESEREQKKWGW